jgi:hypothetical protein
VLGLLPRTKIFNFYGKAERKKSGMYMEGRLGLGYVYDSCDPRDDESHENNCLINLHCSRPSTSKAHEGILDIFGVIRGVCEHTVPIK